MKINMIHYLKIQAPTTIEDHEKLQRLLNRCQIDIKNTMNLCILTYFLDTFKNKFN